MRDFVFKACGIFAFRFVFIFIELLGNGTDRDMWVSTRWQFKRRTEQVSSNLIYKSFCVFM